jgi:hypothetical protein
MIAKESVIMRRWIGGLVILGMLSVSSTAYAAEPVKIIVKGKVIQTDVTPIMDKGRVLVPIRAITEALGATVAWDQDTRTATISKWVEKIKLTVGHKTALIEAPSQSAKPYKLPLDVSIRNVNNRIYVPLRLLSEFYGYQISWQNNTVSVQSPLSSRQQTILNEGMLTEARKFVMNLPFKLVHYANPPLPYTNEREGTYTEYLFPEGEAHRFYILSSNGTVSFYELQDDFFIITWQAHLPIGPKSDLELFLDNKVTDQTGAAPTINKPYFYYSNSDYMTIHTERTGSIDLTGKVTKIGYKRTNTGEIQEQTGSLSLMLPDETRDE